MNTNTTVTNTPTYTSWRKRVLRADKIMSVFNMEDRIREELHMRDNPGTSLVVHDYRSNPFKPVRHYFESV